MQKLNALKCSNIILIILLVFVVLSFVSLNIIKVDDYLPVKGQFEILNDVSIFKFNLLGEYTNKVILDSKVYIKSTDARNILTGVVNKKVNTGIKTSGGTVMSYIVKLDEANYQSAMNNKGEYHIILGRYSLIDFIIKQLLNTDTFV